MSGRGSCSLRLCRRYDLRPFRHRRMHRQSIMIKAPKGFMEQVFWPEFQELNAALVAYLSEITEKVIREEVYLETGERGSRRADADWGMRIFWRTLAFAFAIGAGCDRSGFRASKVSPALLLSLMATTSRFMARTFRLYGIDAPESSQFYI